MKKLLLLLSVLTFNLALAQEKASPMHPFDNLAGGTWKVEDSWGDGSPFKQHIEFEWGLSGKMVKVKTYGNVSREGNEFGLRNEGVRIWSDEASSIKFWEFDIFGGITEGTVETDGKDMYYHYPYDTGQGPTELTDAWIYRDKDTYEFIVGVYHNGVWKQKYLATKIKRNK